MGLKVGTAENMLKIIEEGNGRLHLHPLVSLRWSPEEPTETGWYWLRSAQVDDDDSEIVLVRGDTCKKRAFSVDGGKMWVENYTGVEWAGPISLPAN